MEHFRTIEPDSYTAFDNDSDQLEKGKEWGLISEKAVKMKVLFYKKDGKSMPCEIVGYADKVTAVIRFEDGRLHCIHPSYLKEMQAASFGSKAAGAAESADEAAAAIVDAGAGAAEAVGTSAREEETTDTNIASERAVNTSAGAEESVGSSAEAIRAGAAPSEAANSSTTATKASASSDDPPWETTPDDRAGASSPAATKSEAPSKKGKKEKIELPEGKVRLTATVQEFTTVPNHFSDTDDEVVIYEAVSIVDPPLELGDAWSSHSATLKKLELAVGDTITFDAKLVAKKLTKHPVPYKINNPAKIEKV